MGREISGHVGLTAAGAISGPPGSPRRSVWAEAEIALSDIDLDAAGTTAKGGATIDKGEPTLADLTITLGPGAFLEQGHASGSLLIKPGPEGTHAHLQATGNKLVFPGGAAGRGTPVSLSADGPLTRLAYHVDALGGASGVAGRLTGSGVLNAASADRSLTFAGSGRVGSADFHTSAPAQIDVRAAGLSGALHLAMARAGASKKDAGSGRVDVTFDQAGTRLNGRAVLSDLDIGLVDSDLRGKAEGVVTLGRAGAILTGSARARFSGLASRDADRGTSLSGAMDATLAHDAVVVAAQMTGAQGARLSVDLRLPADLSADPFRLALDSRRPMSGRFSADGAIGPLWDLMAEGRQSLGGRLVAEGTIGGTLADPRPTGTVSIVDGSFEDAGVGLVIKDLAVSATLRGDAVDVASLAATDGAKGSISGSGRLSLVRNGDSSLRLGFKGFKLFDTALGQGDRVGRRRRRPGRRRQGAARRGPGHRSRTDIRQPADALRRRTDGGRGDPPADRWRGSPVKGRRKGAAGGHGHYAQGPGGIFIKGRGLNLEMSLDAKVGGTSEAPVLTGVARVVRGDYDFAAKRFQLDDRSAVFLGSTPETIRLDLTATRDDPTLTAVINIKGTAAAPLLTLSSTPTLPQDEVLSQVLFGASASQLSGFQAAQLASAVAGMAGNGGFDVIGGLRNFAHLDRLAIDSSAATGFTVAGGKYINDKVYIELSNSARTGQGAQVEWRVRKHLSIVSRITDEGDHALSIRWRKDYGRK